MHVRDVMTRDVVTVGPRTSAKHAAEVMAEQGFAALPVLDVDGQLAGIVAEADVLRDRIPPDPRLHLRRDVQREVAPPLVRGVMTETVRTVDAGADVADVSRLFVDERLRSVPVLEHGRLVGIVSRRDLLRAVSRPDDDVRRDLLHLVEDYTGDLGAWSVEVAEGLATVRRTRGAPHVSPAVEEGALTSLARTVPGVVGIRVVTGPADTPAGAETAPS